LADRLLTVDLTGRRSIGLAGRLLTDNLTGRRSIGLADRLLTDNLIGRRSIGLAGRLKIITAVVFRGKFDDFSLSGYIYVVFFKLRYI
jgi:hypothetical protein